MIVHSEPSTAHETAATPSAREKEGLAAELELDFDILKPKRAPKAPKGRKRAAPAATTSPAPDSATPAGADHIGSIAKEDDTLAVDISVMLTPHCLILDCHLW